MDIASSLSSPDELEASESTESSWMKWLKEETPLQNDSRVSIITLLVLLKEEVSYTCASSVGNEVHVR